ncbi:MAG: sulfite exporter TauE/SafE family protein [Candidatus Thorarchaeota archaeon]
MNYMIFVPVAFFLIALIFSMLGMGGSQLYIPILFWMGMDFKTQAIPLGMLLNVINSSSAAVTYYRKRLIDFRMALPFAVAMVVFAPLGTIFNLSVPVTPLIVIFAVFTATAAVLMLSGWRPARHDLSRRERVILGLCGGSVLGFFAGLIGRGGGSFVVPMLYMAGLDPKVAAATSALVVTCSGSASFLSHVLTAAAPDWAVWIASAVAVLGGSQIGSRLMAHRARPRHIRAVFGMVLLCVAALLLVQALFLG